MPAVALAHWHANGTPTADIYDTSGPAASTALRNSPLRASARPTLTEMAQGQSPPPEAYETVTNPERFRVLHEAARQIFDDLVRQYAVERRDYLTADPSRPDAEAPAVRLVPARRDAGPLAIVFTAFPSLLIALGRWRQLSLPACGCDGCDDDPAELIEELHEEIGALVGGTFAERLSHGFRARTRWGRSTDPEGHWGWIAVSRSEAKRMGPAERIDWVPWPRRSA
jgi:Family of unknown function (DUF6226)